MKFSCFPTPSILGQRGSINLAQLPRAGTPPASSSQTNGIAREPATVMSYKRSVEPAPSTPSVIQSPVVSPSRIILNNVPKVQTKRAAPQPPSIATLENNYTIPAPLQTPSPARSPAPVPPLEIRPPPLPAPNPEPSPGPANVRKGGVIGETPAPLSAPIPVYEKDARSRAQIKNAIRSNEFLGNLEEHQVDDLVSAMYPKEIAPRTLVIRQGDIGAHLYVSAEGKFNIYDGNMLTGSFGPGVAFGELALLYSTKRLRSIEVSKEGGKIWVLDTAVFRTVMMRSVQDRLQANIRFLRRITIFHSLPEPKDRVLAKISDLLRVKFFAPGTRILRQGDEGDTFYIISVGQVKITKDTSYGGEEQMVILDRGKYFGEKALLSNSENRRQANAIALPPGVECFTLDRQSFMNYLGGLEEIRTKDWMAEYEKQKRSLTMTWTSEYANLQLSELERKGTLGVGGFGRVELVVPRSMPDKSFALKMLKKRAMVDQQQQEHVLNEKRIMQACNSPFICRLYQTYKDKKYLYFLMEVCLGGDVWTTLQRRRQFNDPTAQFMVGCVIEALDHLHSLNIVYRDLKPENLMLDTEGYLKLVDFGFSKKIGPDKTWTFAGTPEYVAPEIILNKGHDRAVDYWALGILTHELLVGKPPFRDHDHMSTYNKILKGIDAVSIPNNVSKSANNFIRKLLRLSPSERLGYQRAGVREIRDHKWYQSFNWEALQKRMLPAPIVPEVRNHMDTRNFEKYPADRDSPPDEFSGWDQDF